LCPVTLFPPSHWSQSARQSVLTSGWHRSSLPATGRRSRIRAISRPARSLLKEWRSHWVPGGPKGGCKVKSWPEASGCLVAPLVFKTSERRAASLAGSIPVRLRHLHGLGESAHLRILAGCPCVPRHCRRETTRRVSSCTLGPPVFPAHAACRGYLIESTCSCIPATAALSASHGNRSRLASPIFGTGSGNRSGSNRTRTPQPRRNLTLPANAGCRAST
jgi:hypothetical protein